MVDHSSKFQGKTSRWGRRTQSQSLHDVAWAIAMALGEMMVYSLMVYFVVKTVWQIVVQALALLSAIYLVLRFLKYCKVIQDGSNALDRATCAAIEWAKANVVFVARRLLANRRRQQQQQKQQEPPEECVICLDPMTDDDPGDELRCGHIMHKDCVDEWRRRGGRECPTCRKGI